MTTKETHKSGKDVEKFVVGKKLPIFDHGNHNDQR